MSKLNSAVATFEPNNHQIPIDKLADEACACRRDANELKARSHDGLVKLIARSFPLVKRASEDAEACKIVFDALTSAWMTEGRNDMLWTTQLNLKKPVLSICKLLFGADDDHGTKFKTASRRAATYEALLINSVSAGEVEEYIKSHGGVDSLAASAARSRRKEVPPNASADSTNEIPAGAVDGRSSSSTSPEVLDGQDNVANADGASGQIFSVEETVSGRFETEGDRAIGEQIVPVATSGETWQPEGHQQLAAILRSLQANKERIAVVVGSPDDITALIDAWGTGKYYRRLESIPMDAIAIPCFRLTLPLPLDKVSNADVVSKASKASRSCPVSQTRTPPVCRVARDAGPSTGVARTGPAKPAVRKSGWGDLKLDERDEN